MLNTQERDNMYIEFTRHLINDYKESLVPESNDLIEHITENCVCENIEIKEVDLENRIIYQDRVYLIRERFYKFRYEIKFLVAYNDIQENLFLESAVEVFPTQVTSTKFTEKAI